MNNQTIAFISQWSDSIPDGSGLMLQDRLAKLDEDKIPALAAITLKSPIVGLILGLFLGYFGADRFYKGDIGLGVLKIISMFFLVGFIWMFIDLFLVWKGIKEDNLKKISQHLTMLGV